MPISTLTVYGKAIDLADLPLLGEGGEARVYDLSRIFLGKVIKVFRDVSEFKGKEARERAAERLSELKKKLKSYPQLPQGVAGPEGIILKGDEIAAVVSRKVDGFSLGYLLSLEWRRNKGYSEEKARATLAQYCATLDELHLRGIVQGDIKPDNVIVSDSGPVIIDAEGFQYGKYRGYGFTPEYVDPLISWLDKKGELRAASKFSPETDWFGVGVIAFQILTFVSPYGGTLWRSRCKEIVRDEERPFKGYHVFRKEVTVPKFARVRHLSPELAEYFESLFSHKHRKPFPIELLGGVRSSIARCKFYPAHGGITSSSQL